MNKVFNLYNLLNSADEFWLIMLLLILIIYTLFAIVVAFQIFSFNKTMEQETYAPAFKTTAILHVALSFILLLLVVFSL